MRTEAAQHQKTGGEGLWEPVKIFLMVAYKCFSSSVALRGG